MHVSLRSLACALSVIAASALAQVDTKASMPLLLKILTYDQNFDARGVGPFVILLVSAPSQTKDRERLIAELNEQPVKVKSRPVKFVGADYVNEGQLQAEIDKQHASALLITPGMPLALVKPLWEVAQDNQLYALTFDAPLIEVLPIGVTVVADKPQILINERASKAVGVRFETSVLRLAKVVQEPAASPR